MLQETLSGHQVVKSFGAEDIESNRFRDRAERLRSSNLRYVAQQAIASPLIEFFAAHHHRGPADAMPGCRSRPALMSTGEFTSFVIALLMLYEPVKRLTGIHNIFQQALGASQKVFEYLDREQQVKEEPGAARLARFEKAIVFDHVSFRYPDVAGGTRCLDRCIDLEVKAGEVVALVGPSGAGKTTLANLVPRFYDVTGGAIRIDGKDLRDLKLASLRDKISIVAQDTFLFNDTVGANIGYGLRHATPEQVHQAARDALAEEFILRMPEGYDTIIGERGRQAERRPAAAAGDRAGVAQERADPDPGRGHLASGHRIRGAGAAGAANLDGEPHGDRDRAPAVDRAPGRQDRRARPRAHRRNRPARRAGQPAAASTSGLYELQFVTSM